MVGLRLGRQRPRISVITTCKGRLEHLKLTLPALMALEGCEVVVVDYDCPDGAGEWVRQSHPRATVVRIEDRPLFNLARARNLGAAAATAPWLFFVDADVIVSRDFAPVLRSMLRPGGYLAPNPRPDDLWGAILVAREDFQAIGGYDEAFEGWGSEDVDIAARLDFAGRVARTFPGELLSTVAHDDALRGRFHAIADLRLNGAINAFYRNVKMDLLRQGVSLDAEQARRLYAEVRDAVTAGGATATLTVPLPPRPFHERTLAAAVTYEMSRRGSPPDAQG